VHTVQYIAEARPVLITNFEYPSEGYVTDCPPLDADALDHLCGDFDLETVDQIDHPDGYDSIVKATLIQPVLPSRFRAQLAYRYYLVRIEEDSYD
jgi:hypothetical protein